MNSELFGFRVIKLAAPQALGIKGHVVILIEIDFAWVEQKSLPIQALVCSPSAQQ